MLGNCSLDQKPAFGSSGFGFRLIGFRVTRGNPDGLSTFERNEKAKMEHALALNSLESAVYDYTAKLEEDSFSGFGTEEELQLVRQKLKEMKDWLEDMPSETSVEELKQKRREVVESSSFIKKSSPIRKLKNRKRQKEELENELSNPGNAEQKNPGLTLENIWNSNACHPHLTLSGPVQPSDSKVSKSLLVVKHNKKKSKCSSVFAVHPIPKTVPDLYSSGMVAQQ
uniref:Cwf21 domain-containing protein n=1 Tax=Globodera pallida TaxID=36090 RepID=A0A183CNG2_GLOPA